MGVVMNKLKADTKKPKAAPSPKRTRVRTPKMWREFQKHLDAIIQRDDAILRALADA